MNNTTFQRALSIAKWGSVRKMRIYNAKEVPIIKKADFQSLKESTF